MCHICDKVDKLKKVDSKLLRPLIKALIGIHGRAEPSLGDFWWIRNEKTTKLRDLVDKLAESGMVPRAAGDGLRRLLLVSNDIPQSLARTGCEELPIEAHITA